MLSSQVRFCIGFAAALSADTNPLLDSASCCNEAFKIATSSAAYLDNYFMFIGTDAVYSFTFQYEKRAECPVCGGESLNVEISKEWTVDRLIEMLVERQDMYVFLLSSTPTIISPQCIRQIKKPSLSSEAGSLYFQAPPQLEEATRPNLEKKVSELVEDGGDITVTASTLPFTLTLRVSYS